MSLQKLIVAALIAAPMLAAGCYAPEYRPPPPVCRSYWIPAHYDRAGFWHRGHWACR